MGGEDLRLRGEQDHRETNFALPQGTLLGLPRFMSPGQPVPVPTSELKMEHSLTSVMGTKIIWVLACAQGTLEHMPMSVMSVCDKANVQKLSWRIETGNFRLGNDLLQGFRLQRLCFRKSTDSQLCGWDILLRKKKLKERKEQKKFILKRLLFLLSFFDVGFPEASRFSVFRVSKLILSYGFNQLTSRRCKCRQEAIGRYPTLVLNLGGKKDCLLRVNHRTREWLGTVIDPTEVP